MAARNVERLEHLVAALNEAHAAVERSSPSEANARIDDAEGIATDAEENGAPQRFAEATTAANAEEAEDEIRADHPTLLVAGVVPLKGREVR